MMDRWLVTNTTLGELYRQLEREVKEESSAEVIEETATREEAPYATT